MTDKKIFFFLFINFLIFFYSAYNNISIKLGDKIYSQLKFFIFHSFYKVENKYLYFKDYFKTIDLLKKQIDTLKKENQLLKIKNFIQDDFNIKFIEANVIVYSYLTNEDYLFINKGLASNVYEGMGVISDKGLIGIVVRSYTDYSKVLFLTDIRFSIDAMIKESKIKGLLTGFRNGLCKLKYLPVTAKIEIGQEVVTTSFSKIFPTGIPIGEIVDIKKNNLYKTCIVRPYKKKWNVDKVYIIKR